MIENLKLQLAKITQLGQRQDGTSDQLDDLRPFAVRLGLQDAANKISDKLEPDLSPYLQLQLDKVEQQPVSDATLKDQLIALRGFAIRLGFYDADDYLKAVAAK